MKNPRSFLLVFAFIVSFLTYAQEATKTHQVMASHDEVMAKMPNLAKLIGKLQPQVDSTKTGQKHQEAINALKTNNTAMMTWMQGSGEHFTADEMIKESTYRRKKDLA